MPKAILFDLDGTLADTIPTITLGVNLTMEQLGYPTHSEASVRSFINHGARMLIRSAMPLELQEDEALVDTVLSSYNHHYRGVHLQTDHTYAGMRELVERLHRHFRIGVLSNKQDEMVQNLAAQLLSPNSWDAAQGTVEGYPTKPHPYLAQLITQTLGVLPSECVMVGDSDVDLLTAKNAGMTHIGVTWGYRTAQELTAAGATMLASTPLELERLILSLA
ncbi:MAG: HAD family hydrolase [Ruminococcaceae bacterium]|nr:HAD family hydrolase [Oscillospiraceae bacterium]